MSLFNRFCAKAGDAIKTVGEKTETLVQSASRSVKIKSLEIKIDEQYEKLGSVVYRDLHVDEDLEEEKLQIIAAIDALFDRITELKSEPIKEAEFTDVSDAEADGEQPAAEEIAEEPVAEEEKTEN